jgi:hypothetical protein
VFPCQYHPLSGLIRPSDLFVPAVTGDENCRSHPALWDPASFHNTDFDLNEEPTSPHITNVDLNTNFEILFADGRLVSGKQYTDNVTIAGFTVCVYCLRISSLLTNE